MKDSNFSRAAGCSWKTGGMNKGQAIVGSSLFLALAPGSVVGLLPYLFGLWHMRPALFGLGATRAIGALLILLGVPLLLESFARFALVGHGTPAPISPPEILVVSGLYRFVRNPMYVAIITVLLGEFLFTANPRLLTYGLTVFIFFHLFVIFYEEPTLARKFGGSYQDFKRNVPRWLPRLTPWRGGQAW